MQTRFDLSLQFVLRHESVYAPGHEGDPAYTIAETVPGDPGACTKYGIDATDHPGIDIPNLTLQEARHLYQNGEWTACACDLLPGRIDTAVFDCAVNNGVATSVILLQRALREHGFPLAEDGEIGPKTTGAANAEAEQYGDELLNTLLILRKRLYADIVLHKPGEAKFLRGWNNRVADLQQFLQ